MKQYTILNKSCLDAMDQMKENSIDCIITDPPYEIGFMNKGWDNTGIAFSVDTWKKALRVLKSGGYLLAFNHSRTFHRMAVAIEDAGFQIRDTIMWLYGNGFPKSHNISLALDKSLGFQEQRGVGGFNVGGRLEQNNRKAKLHIGSITDGSKMNGYNDPKSDEAKKWNGWGTALKPAYEPIIMARKPFKTSVAENVLKYGVGGINIDECRVGDEEIENGRENRQEANSTSYFDKLKETPKKIVIGRFPANIIHDGSDEVVIGFPETTSSGGSFKANDYVERETATSFTRGDYVGRNDSGSASRFFYTTKASKKDREEGLDDFEKKSSQYNSGGLGRKISVEKRLEIDDKNTAKMKNIHPTVKPTDLMQYLIRLVAPKGATILDIFMGSGSTGKACMLENVERNADYHFIGVELEKEYCDIAKARIEWAINYKDIEIEKSEKRMVGEKEAKQLSIFDI